MRQQLHGRFTAGCESAAGVARIPDGLLPQLRVTVGGDPLRGVVAGDTWQGWVDVIRRDDGGRFVMLAGAAQLERYHGRVEAWLVKPTFDDIDVLTRAGLALG